MSLWLVDANILVRPLQPGNAQGAEARNAVNTLLARGETLCWVPQIIYEFWVVCTRPAGDNGLGLSPAATLSQIQQMQTAFVLLADSNAIFPAWLSLVANYGVSGKKAHDARLVATMQVHGLTHLLTFNAADFRRYPGITVIEPHQV